VSAISKAVLRGSVRGQKYEAHDDTPGKQELKKRMVRVMDLHNQGLNLRQIGEKIGLQGSTVGYWVQKGRKHGMDHRKLTKKGAHTNGAGPVTGTHEREEIDSGSQADQKLQNHISYCFGHTEAWLEAYCNGAGISKSNVAKQLADLLHRTARR